jgi:hypothetical protein
MIHKKNFKTSVAVSAMSHVTEIIAQTAAISTELQQLKSAKRSEVDDIRRGIIDEYEVLVKELVQEIHVLSNRFNEFRTNTLKDVMNIISDAKREEFKILLDKIDIPEVIKKTVEQEMAYQNEIQRYREENHELKMTVLFYNSYQVALENTIHVFHERASLEICLGKKT